MAINHKENIALIGFVGTTMLSGALLTLPSALADDVVDTITITVPSSCSISSTGENSHTAEINNGQYDSSIGETTIKAFCNDNEGFAIYAIGYTDNELGKNVLTNSTLGSTHDIITGTAITGNTSNWAMKLSTITSPTPNYPIIIAGSTDDAEKEQDDSDFSNFTNVPDVYKKVAYRTSATDINSEGQQTAEGSTLKTTYQAYISPTQASGEYTGQVKYTMVHPANEQPLQPQTSQSGKICYYANASGYEGTMGCQNVSSSVTLLASNFSREGYGFAGWSDAFDYATNTNAHFYGPQETITIPDTSIYTGEGKGLSLYAVWVKSQGNLQDATKVATLCGTGTGSLTKADEATNILSQSITALSDARDNNTYAIAKLADGKCWMIENLRLDNTAEHNTDGTLSQGYHSSFIGLSGSELANFNDSTTANDLYTTENDIQGKTTISGDYQAYRFPRYNNTNTSTRAEYTSGQNVTSQGVNIYSYGNYYTWHAAIADTTHNESKNNSSDTTSICPKGWRLPHGGQTTVNTTAEFYLLGKAIMNNIEPDQNASYGAGYYGDSVTNTAGKTATVAFRSYPNNFLYSGRFDSSSASLRGIQGHYWSSTASNSSSSYFLLLLSSNVHPGTNYYTKYHGHSIRCVSGS